MSTPLGAVALDITQASTSTVRDKLSGQSYRITYNKLISDTQSNIALAAYRFSTRDYLDFAQAMEYQNLQKGNAVYLGSLYRTKNRYSLTLSQGLTEGWGHYTSQGCRRTTGSVMEMTYSISSVIPTAGVRWVTR